MNISTLNIHTKNKDTSPYAFRYWPIWIVMGILWSLIQFPYSWQLKIGAGLGKLAYIFAKRERRIATINIQKCFPDWTAEQRQSLLKKSFTAMGIATLETAFGWWAPAKRLEKLITVHGMENLDNALKQGNGALVCTAHFSTLHIVGRLACLQRPFAAFFFPPKNPVFRLISLRSMSRYYHTAIPRDDVRSLIRCLKQNLPVLYTPDTDAGPKNSIFAPFFGIMTATVTATARFTHMTNAALVPGFYYRREDGKGYVIELHPALENYPSDDPYADAVRVNQIIEKAVLEHPEQYLWQYKRFKTRPQGEQKFY